MVAGRGITHSERFERARRKATIFMAFKRGSRCQRWMKKPSRASVITRAVTCRYGRKAVSAAD